MKKILAIVLAFVMVMSLAACSKKSNDNSQNSNQTQSSDKGGNTGEKKGKVTHLVMSFMTWTGAPADTQKIQDAINKITVDKYGIEVELHISDSSSYKQNLTLALSSGEQLDVFSTIMSNYPVLAQQGYLLDLEDKDLLNKYGQGISDAVGKEYLDACRVNGVLYALPNNRDMASGRGCATIATEYLDGIGYKVDKNVEIQKITVDELNKIYEQLHAKYPKLEVYRPVPLSMSQFSNVDLLGGNAFGVLTDYGKELKVENLFTSEYYKNYVSRMYDYNQKGYISKDAATDTTAVTALVKAGTLMGYTTGGKPGIKQQESNLCGRPMTIFQTADDYVSSSAVASFPWAISYNTVNAQASMTLMKALYTDSDLANLLSWGIKDEHYKVLDNGQITFADGVDSSKSGWNHNVTWELPNEFITHIWEGNSKTLWQDLKDFNKNAKKSAASGFTFDPTNVSTEITSVQNVYDEYQKSLEYGFINPDKGIKEMNSKMMDAGLDKIIAEKQKQLDKWATTK